MQAAANARAEVKQTSLLGEKYVDARAAARHAGRRRRSTSGDTIPITRTGSAPEIEEVLGALSLLLNGGGLQQIKIITTELNKALDGNEPAVRDLLNQLNTFVGHPRPAEEPDPRPRSTSVNRLAITLNNNKRTIEQRARHLPAGARGARQNDGRS